MMTAIRTDRAGTRRDRRPRLKRAALGVVLLAACNSMDVVNTNAPTAETLTGAPTRDVLGRTAIGIQTQVFTSTGGMIQQWGIYGREG